MEKTYKTFKKDDKTKSDEEIEKLLKGLKGVKYRIKKSIHFIINDDFKTNENKGVAKFINENFNGEDSGTIYV
ncbi:hypothetical protein [Psychroflexus planctonicus]|uniref:Uncharacterized protein n=1 Tax=Psychroflexus planctonicus TaxID=1526575 RepID=A0ABQ1SCS5_9FLAO|nr:hypothetical protein [Psychroflexus planctonicus]GGE28899.1 hypothetical protein GCM10010832_06920 [Psychroflexus planctonicus]